jgi:hypothetical protein
LSRGEEPQTKRMPECLMLRNHIKKECPNA